MKLGILCTMINGFGRRGYYNSQEIGLGRELARMGHQVTIYKGVSQNEKADRVKLPEGVTVRYLPMKSLGAHGWAECRCLSPKMDGLFVFGDQQIFLPHVYRWCKRHHVCFVPYVGTAHSLHENFKSKVMNLLFAMGTLRIYKTHSVLAKTTAAREELLNLGVRDIRIAPVGLDKAVLKQDFRNYDRDEIRRKHGFEPDDVIICNVSRLSWEKRPLDLIDIFMKVRKEKKFRLIIVGNGELEQPLRKKIHDCGVENEVKIYENVPYEKMWEIYVMSDYYLNLNKGEIFGMAIMEAVYYCTSVAAFNALGPSITLKGMKGHKICNSDEELAEWLMAEYPSRIELEESSGKMAETFTWERCANAFLRIIKEEKQK